MAFNENVNKVKAEVKGTQANDDDKKIKNKVCNDSDTKSSWNVLVIKSDSIDENEGVEMMDPCQSHGSLVSQLSRLELEHEIQATVSEEIVEHSQQLILGLTHSLKNMLTKLSPSIIPVAHPSGLIGPEGYSFSYKTSKYRLYYFESFTGWKLIMITDCNQPTAATSTATTTITPETVLKSFYSQILLKFLVAYPLGKIYTSEKSTETRKVFVEDDFLHRSGFLSKMDEFIINMDRIF